MAFYEGKEGRWITTETGRHIFIEKGKSIKEALGEAFDEDYKEDFDTDDYDKDFDKNEIVYYKNYSGFPRKITKEEYDKLPEWQKGEFEITDDLKDLLEEFSTDEMVDEYEKKELIDLFWQKLRNLSVYDRRLLTDIFKENINSKYKDKGRRVLESIPKAPETTAAESLSLVNVDHYNESLKHPYKSKERDKYTCNCQRCVIAYEMRRRGYDVEAGPYERGDNLAIWKNNIRKSFSNYDEYVHTQKYDTRPDGSKYSSRSQLIKAMEADMLNKGEGARFILDWDWKNFSCGHTVNAEIIDGKVSIFDSQTGNSYSIQDLINRKDLRATTLTCTRVDNLELSGDVKGVVTWKK